MFFRKARLSKAIQKRKTERICLRINKINGNYYHLKGHDNAECALHINFDGLTPLPQVNDVLYLSETVIDAIREKLFTFTFSAHIGETYARQPHDFLKEPKEFLILEYNNGKIVLLEQWYG